MIFFADKLVYLTRIDLDGYVSLVCSKWNVH